MSIEFTCPHCESLLRVEDANAGKRARCPHCGAINRIPGEVFDPTPAAPVSQQFFVDSVSGQTYGPITKPELDQWVSEGRISASCMIRATGEATGQPAPVYYPALAEKTPLSQFDQTLDSTDLPPSTPPEKSTSFDPYASPIPTPAKPAGFQSINVEGITPVRIELGEVFKFAYELFTRHIGLLIGAAAVCMIPQLLISIIEEAAQDRNGFMGPLPWLAVVALNLTQTYLVIGQTRISLRIVRGQPVEFSELFTGGDKFLPIIGFSLLIAIPLFCGLLLLIVPGVFLMLYFWPSYTLIVDYKSSVFDSFGIAYRIGECNLLNSFVLGLASFGIIVVGFLACCVGVIPASGYVSVLWATAYLMMSGQISLRPIQ